jgi:hypothetical protein
MNRLKIRITNDEGKYVDHFGTSIDPPLDKFYTNKELAAALIEYAEFLKAIDLNEN